MNTKADRLINLLALGMIISVVPAILRAGIERQNLIVSVLEWSVYTGSILSGIGLILRKEWAPALAIRILAVTFGWVMYQIIFYIGQQFSLAALIFSQVHEVSRSRSAQVLLWAVIGYLLWPVTGIMILTHPGIRRRFSPQSL